MNTKLLKMIAPEAQTQRRSFRRNYLEVLSFSSSSGVRVSMSFHVNPDFSESSQVNSLFVFPGKFPLPFEKQPKRSESDIRHSYLNFITTYCNFQSKTKERPATLTRPARTPSGRNTLNQHCAHVYYNIGACSKQPILKGVNK